MRFHVEQRDGRWLVLAPTTREVVATCDTEDAARREAAEMRELTTQTRKGGWW